MWCLSEPCIVQQRLSVLCVFEYDSLNVYELTVASISTSWYTLMFMDQLKSWCRISRCVDDIMVAFVCFLLFCRIGVSLTHSLFPLSILSFSLTQYYNLLFFTNFIIMTESWQIVFSELHNNFFTYTVSLKQLYQRYYLTLFHCKKLFLLTLNLRSYKINSPTKYKICIHTLSETHCIQAILSNYLRRSER